MRNSEKNILNVGACGRMNNLHTPGLGRGPSEQLKPSCRLGTQFMIKFINCGLLSCSKLELLERGLEKLPFDILGLAEVGEKGLDLINNKTGWFTSTQPTFRSGGVALFVGKRLIDSVIESRTTNDRSLAVRFKTQTGDLSLIIAYGPHEGYQVSHYISFLTGLETLTSLSSRR